MPTVLITGCSRGLGLEFVRQYSGDGWRVIATCRHPHLATELTAIPGEIEIHSLDVSDFTAVDSMATTLLGTPIDVLVLNAGINPQKDATLAETDFESWPNVMRVNVMAPAKIASAFRPHLAASQIKVVVGISSQAGSITLNQRGRNFLYRTSKAGLNMVITGIARELAEEEIISVSILPGATRTNMGGPEAPRSPEQSVRDMRRVIANLKIQDSGSFIDFDGQNIPW